jgi:hypothetical protein
VASAIQVETCRGAALARHLPALARLRLTVFRAWPYLYDGTPEYEETYLATYLRAPGAAIAIAWDGSDIIGAATCLPMQEAAAEVQSTFQNAGWSLAPIFYFGESVLLAPSCTDSLHGFNRVRLSARARALENQCFVAITPTVGLAPTLASLDENHGYAAIFGPVNRGFPADGIIARGTLDQPGLVIADLDPSVLHSVRANGAVRNHADWPVNTPPCVLTEAL